MVEAVRISQLQKSPQEIFRPMNIENISISSKVCIHFPCPRPHLWIVFERRIFVVDSIPQPCFLFSSQTITIKKPFFPAAIARKNEDRVARRRRKEEEHGCLFQIS